jgi:tetratricopeptide (TPR) repeat protein
LYVVGGGGAMLFPTLPAEAPAGDERAVEDVNWGVHQEELGRAENAEFREKDFKKALAGYTALASRRLTDLQRAALQKNIAACYKKMGDLEKAGETYQTIAKNFDALPDPTGLPTGLLARKLLADVYRDGRRDDQAAETLAALALDVILGRWPLAARSYEDVLSDIDKKITALGKPRPETAALPSLRRRMDAARASAARFSRNEWPGLRRKITDRGWIGRGGVVRWEAGPFWRKDERWFVMVPADAPAGPGQESFIVAEIAPLTLLEALQLEFTDIVKPLGMDLAWGESPPGAAPASPVKETVPAFEPPLAFWLLGASAESQSRFVERRSRIYLGIVGLSAVVILVGLFVMFHAVKS